VQKNIFNGWILVNKPAGITSADVVRVLKKKMNPTKIGHAGTLDPDATGLIPIALGEATKAIPYLLKSRKKYEASFLYGLKTDTDDSSGTTRKASNYIPRKNEILEALKYYSEVPFQVPPKVSAVKIKGKRAYERFKAKETFQLTARRINVYTLSLQSYDKKGQTLVHFECSKGGYVRSIARDIGDFLGCFGHVGNLERIEYGPFKADKATDLSDLLDLSIENLISRIMDIEIGIPGLKIFECNSDDVRHLENGRPIECPVAFDFGEGEELIAKYKGKVAGILFREEGFLKIKRKFNT
jgi:tRNA pseudouridine55 synthase